eukprot:scaffold88243_cov49-Phaeocystis_antarctica.AAC.1
MHRRGYTAVSGAPRSAALGYPASGFRLVAPRSAPANATRRPVRRCVVPPAATNGALTSSGGGSWPNRVSLLVGRRSQPLPRRFLGGMPLAAASPAAWSRQRKRRNYAFGDYRLGWP